MLTLPPTLPLRRSIAVGEVSAVDYKVTAALRMFVSERGKTRPRQVTGLTVQQQRQVSTAISNAREMALLPYPGQIAGR